VERKLGPFVASGAFQEMEKQYIECKIIKERQGTLNNKQKTSIKLPPALDYL
jgi:hypothetical protein